MRIIPESMLPRCKFTPWAALVLWLLQGWLATPLYAAVAPDFYLASVPVADRGTAARQESLRTALAQLLVRISGDPSVHQYPNAASLLTQPGRFVQQYQYVPGGRPDALDLSVVFDGNALEQAMRAAALPVWGRERPEIMAWVAVEERAQRRLLAADDEASVKVQLEQTARQRGLPLLLPLMDLEDQAAVNIADVWGGFVEPLRRAASRYRTQVMLLGRVSGGGDYWTGRWVLDFNQQRETFATQGSSPHAVVSSGIEELANRMASQLAVRGVEASSGAQMLVVEGITSITDVARVSDYLQRLSLVDDVTLHRVAPGRVELLVTLNGGIGYLHQAVAVGNQLEVQVEQPVPVYRLKR